MQYASLNEQLEIVINILKQNKNLMLMLDYVTELNLPNFYIAAGAIFQTIWNYYDGNDLNFRIKDIDVVYYNDEDLSVEKDLEYYKLLKDYVDENELGYDVDVSNEARMHLWYKERGKEVPQYKNSEDAITNWLVTVHAIGITKEDGKIKVFAPYGLSDIFSKTMRPIKNQYNSKEKYEKKVSSWKKRFDNLNIISWND